jgi:hypothetical protein
LTDSDEPEVESASPRHIVKGHEDFSRPEEDDTPAEEDDDDDSAGNVITDTYDIFTTLETVLNDIETILQIIEISINSSMIIENWEDEDYYTAGYNIGTSGLGIVILIEDIVTVYKDMTDTIDDATSPDDEEEE